MTEREVQFIHQIEDTPYSNPQSIIAPCEVSRIWRRAKHGGCMAQDAVKAEMLHIECNVEGQTPPFRPRKLGSLCYRRIIIPVMVLQLHGGSLISGVERVFSRTSPTRRLKDSGN